jgi:transposase
MTDDEIGGLTSRQALVRHASLSLDDRCKAFNEKSSFVKLSRTMLQKIYKMHKVKKRRIIVRKKPTRRNNRTRASKLNELRERLKDLEESGHTIVYIDETMFTRNTIASILVSWQQHHDSSHFNRRAYSFVLCGISTVNGIETYATYDFSVNKEKFVQNLEALRRDMGRRKVAIFMDNLSVHRSRFSLDYMKELGFEPVFNLPYEPDFNPIEHVFSKVKHNFKKMRLQKILK